MKFSFSRRDFLKNTGITLAGTALSANRLSPRASSPPVTHLGVQLYSVRDDMSKDPVGTIGAIAKMGYREVEGYGYDNGKMFGMSIPEFTKVLRDNGLKMYSSHCGFTLKNYDAGKKDLTDATKKAIDDAAAQTAAAGVAQHLFHMPMDGRGRAKNDRQTDTGVSGRG